MSKILVIDDDRDVRDLVHDVLTVEGYEVCVAGDGVAGLAAVAAEVPDCVVLDVMMPGLDGHEVLRQIRLADGPVPLPVVMLTAAADDQQAWQAWSGGVDYFLPKPFEPIELLRFLDQLFAASALA